jgi:hypothetical protein
MGENSPNLVTLAERKKWSLANSHNSIGYNIANWKETFEGKKSDFVFWQNSWLDNFKRSHVEKIKGEYVGKYVLFRSSDSGKRIKIRDRCYDFLNIFAEKFGEKNGVFDSKQS